MKKNKIKNKKIPKKTVKKIQKKKVTKVEKRNKRPTAPSKSSHYIDKEEFLTEIVACQKADKVSDKLAEMFGKIIEGVSHRFSNLQYYDIADDVMQDCYLLLIQKYKNFKAKLNTSCFAYFTTVVYNQMRYQLTKARRYKDHKDHMINTVIEYVDAHKHYFLDNEEEDE